MKVKVSKKLYIGENAHKDHRKIIKNVKKSKLQFNVFLIIMSDDENGLVEIYPSYIFLHPHFKKTEISIVGISKGYNEAVELVKVMTEECYNECGNVNLKSYFEF
ncbi:MAG: hypothetical protein E7266_05935 [Lachnospiraceae bacterium]|nr:hypothetical protein [Lachnospiraceae bacterium]